MLNEKINEILKPFKQEIIKYLYKYTNNYIIICI